jgi:hypothetical protein
MQPLVADVNVELSYVYRSAAMIRNRRGWPPSQPARSRAMPGTARHYWLGGWPADIDLDLFGRSSLYSRGGWRGGAGILRAAGELRVPITASGGAGRSETRPAGSSSLRARAGRLCARETGRIRRMARQKC